MNHNHHNRGVHAAFGASNDLQSIYNHYNQGMHAAFGASCRVPPFMRGKMEEVPAELAEALASGRHVAFLHSCVKSAKMYTMHVFNFLTDA